MELCIYGTESNQQACVDSEYNLQGTEDNIWGTQPPMDGQCWPLRPTFDFQQEILWNGEDVEVLEPLWLRKEIAGKIMRMWNKYKNDNQ